MSDRLHEMDPSHAVFAALGSFWWRLVAFFGCFWLGHYVGLNAATGGEFLRAVWQDGPIAAFGESRLNPIYVPLTWFGTVILGCEGGFGALYLFVIGVAFLIVRLSEDRYIHGFALALLLQPIHTLLVVGGAFGRGGSFDPFNCAVALIAILVWEAMIGGLYWWCLRQME